MRCVERTARLTGYLNETTSLDTSWQAAPFGCAFGERRCLSLGPGFAFEDPHRWCGSLATPNSSQRSLTRTRRTLSAVNSSRTGTVGGRCGLGADREGCAVQQPVQADALRCVTPLAHDSKRRAATRARLNVALGGRSEQKRVEQCRVGLVRHECGSELRGLSSATRS